MELWHDTYWEKEDRNFYQIVCLPFYQTHVEKSGRAYRIEGGKVMENNS